MGGINLAALSVQLRRQFIRRSGISQKKVRGMLVVYEINRGVASGQGAAGGHSLRIVASVLDDLDAGVTQAVFLPGFGIQRHMYYGLETQSRGDQADAKAQIAGTAHRHRMRCKE